MRRFWILFLILVFGPLSAGKLFADTPDGGLYSPGSPGDTVFVAYGDLQTYSTSNDHIACDWASSSGVHFVTDSGDPSGSSRHVLYNYYTSAGGMHHYYGIQIDNRPRAGYGTIAVLSDGRAVAFYHGGTPSAPDHYMPWMAIDLIPGMGIFQEFPVDTAAFIGHWGSWPTGTAHWENDYIEIGVVFLSESGPGLPRPDSFAVNRSTDQGLSWTGWVTVHASDPGIPGLGGSTLFAAGMVLAAWTEPDTLLIGDLMFRQSTDYGTTWGFTQSATRLQRPDTLLFSDAFRVFAGHFDACYDSAGEPHFVYPLLEYVGGMDFSNRATLYHWTPSQGRTEIARAWWESNPGSSFGSIQDPSMGINPSNGYLYVVWTQFADIEGPNPDTSLAGISNGEIYLSWSLDNGLTWTAAQNLTNSPSPDCDTGQCDDDRHSNIALLVNDTCHIMYQNDKWAGQQIVQGENPPTNNPILYIRIPPCRPPGVEEAPVSNDRLPISESQLFQNQPNPFSSATTIPFRVSADGRPRTADDVSTYQLVDLSVYDLSGRLVRTLVDGRQSGGVNTAVWDGRDSYGNPVPSGVYFYRLRAGDFESLRKMVVIR